MPYIYPTQTMVDESNICRLIIYTIESCLWFINSVISAFLATVH